MVMKERKIRTAHMLGSKYLVIQARYKKYVKAFAENCKLLQVHILKHLLCGVNSVSLSQTN